MQVRAQIMFLLPLSNRSHIGVTPQRKLKVFVNPHSGPGKAPTLFNKFVEPIFKAARCTIDVSCKSLRSCKNTQLTSSNLDTDHSKHAQEISRELSLDFDAVVILSGDGLAHEVFNGFAEHSNPIGAFAIPIAPIPSGSANGTCLNILGLKVHDSACTGYSLY